MKGETPPSEIDEGPAGIFGAGEGALEAVVESPSALATRRAIEGEGAGRFQAPETRHDTEERLARVVRSRRTLSLLLLPPLLFFFFLVVWFRERLILIPLAAGIYAYMLVQFFILQNPARSARSRRTVGK